jgi:regulator of protease activity HflC (stomatin/prohibitin superfamily)
MGAAIGGVAAVVLVVVVLYVLAGVRIVRPYQRGIIETLGRYRQTVDAGLRIIFPVFQKLRVVDLREQVVDVPPQEVITADNVVVSVDAVIYFEPTDPKRLVYNVADFLLAVTKLAQTNLRNVVGDLDLDAALTSRDQINAALRAILDDATDKWGVRVGRVEIQRIDPPSDVMSAMHEQMKAERTRRAVVTQADGQRQSAIARAEGEKQAAILSAEGVRHRHIIEAEGQAQAIRAVAEAEAFRLHTTATGEADAVRSVWGAIHDADPTPELIAIKTLEALAHIADGQATTVFVPTEMSGVLASLGSVRHLFDTSAHRDPAPSGATAHDGVQITGGRRDDPAHAAAASEDRPTGQGADR